MATHYEVLGLHPSALADEIADRYRALAQQLHPDRNPTDPQAARHFKVIQAAYEVLSQPASRAAHDREIGFPRGSWAEEVPDRPRGSLRLNSDGSFVIGPKTYGAWDTLDHVVLGTTTHVWKKPGPGDLVIIVVGKFWFFKYYGGRWRSWRFDDGQGIEQIELQFLVWHDGARRWLDEMTRQRNAQQSQAERASTSARTNPASSGSAATPPHASAPQTSTTPSGRPRRYLAVAALLAPLVGGGLWIALRPPPSAAEKLAAEREQVAQQEALAVERKRLLAEQAELEAIEARTSAKDQASARVQARLLALQQTAQGVVADVAKLDDEIQKWDQAVRPLLNSDEGRYLAARPDDIRAFRALYEPEVPAAADAEAFRAQLRVLLAPIERELAKELPLVEPNAEVESQLAEHASRVRQLTRDCRERRLQIESLLSQSKRAGAPADMSLETAMAELQLRDSQEKADRLAQAEEAARREALDKAVRDRGEQTREQLEQERLLAEAEALRKRREAELAVKKEQAQDSKVQELLRPFTAAGYWQPDESQTADKRPYSLQRLRNSGALEGTEEGLEKLRKLVAWPGDTDRPRWSSMNTTTIRDLSAGDRDKLRKAQQALVEYGEALVELQLLDP